MVESFLSNCQHEFVGEEPRSNLDSPSELMKLVEGETDQTRPSSSKEMDYMPGNDSDLAKVEVQVMEEGSNSGSSLEEEEREVEKFDLRNYGRLKSSFEEPKELELKPLPEHLEYAFLEEGSKLSVVIAYNLTAEQKDKLVVF